MQASSYPVVLCVIARSDDIFLMFTSFLYPGSVLRYTHDPDFTGTPAFSSFKETKVPGFNADEFVTYRTVSRFVTVQ